MEGEKSEMYQFKARWFIYEKMKVNKVYFYMLPKINSNKVVVTCFKSSGICCIHFM